MMMQICKTFTLQLKRHWLLIACRENSVALGIHVVLGGVRYEKGKASKGLEASDMVTH